MWRHIHFRKYNNLRIYICSGFSSRKKVHMLITPQAGIRA
ncbi:hypothetical protein HMPREF1989_00355 [Porphyromonas gingivalis F0566]|nr:hypothetical protein HMPREF1989_00355 [Porphyromonas gingivalis F0566]